MKVLSLFSGGGLGDYGLELAGMEIVGQVEIDDYCQKILKLRWPEVSKFRDIREVKGNEVIKRCGGIDLISGGFPCQPFSCAGQQRGKEDDRYLWPEMLRVVSEIKPTYVLGENVTGIIKSSLDEVLSDLENIGYSCQSFVIPACAFDAPHKRNRVWIVAYSNSKNVQGGVIKEKSNLESSGTIYVPVSWREWPQLLSAPILCRTDDGIANRVDRTKLLGNGQVVQVVQWIGQRIMEFENDRP